MGSLIYNLCDFPKFVNRFSHQIQKAISAHFDVVRGVFKGLRCTVHFVRIQNYAIESVNTKI